MLDKYCVSNLKVLLPVSCILNFIASAVAFIFKRQLKLIYAFKSSDF